MVDSAFLKRHRRSCLTMASQFCDRPSSSTTCSLTYVFERFILEPEKVFVRYLAHKRARRRLNYLTAIMVHETSTSWSLNLLCSFWIDISVAHR
jgi:hypothetical protein